jgi:hypothetical protein
MKGGQIARSDSFVHSFRSGVTVMSGGIAECARAEALFVTDLQRSDSPTPDQIRTAIRLALRRHGGTQNCAALVAAEFGDHPETAVARMQWVLQAVKNAYPGREDTPMALRDDLPRPRMAPQPSGTSGLV